jgi:hypothetical protein
MLASIPLPLSLRYSGSTLSAISDGELKSVNELVNSCPTIQTVLLAKIEEETLNLKIVIKV